MHPFFDDPSDHLNFNLDAKAILISTRNDSAKGQRTIDLFNLMDPERAKQRAKDLMFDDDVDHLHGLTKDMYLAVVEELAAGRMTMKIAH